MREEERIRIKKREKKKEEEYKRFNPSSLIFLYFQIYQEKKENEDKAEEG